MNDVTIGEPANNLRDCVSLTNVRQELVAQTFADRCAANDSGDVNEINRGWQQTLAAIHRGQALKASVRKVHHTNVWFDCCERIVRRENVVLGECIKEGRLAYVRQSHDSDC